MSSADFDTLAFDAYRGLREHPERINLLDDAEKGSALVDIKATENRYDKADIWRWLTDKVWTIDEASQERAKWPDKVYLRELFAAIDECPMLAIPKSRRMMVTWAVAAWCVHRARFFPNVAVFWQSETEDKAAYVVQNRAAYIEDNITPSPFRPTAPKSNR